MASYAPFMSYPSEMPIQSTGRRKKWILGAVAAGVLVAAGIVLAVILVRRQQRAKIASSAQSAETSTASSSSSSTRALTSDGQLASIPVRVPEPTPSLQENTEYKIKDHKGRFMVAGTASAVCSKIVAADTSASGANSQWLLRSDGRQASYFIESKSAPGTVLTYGGSGGACPGRAPCFEPKTGSNEAAYTVMHFGDGVYTIQDQAEGYFLTERDGQYCFTSTFMSNPNIYFTIYA